jgi:2-polyprenyl-3-methyl-5-hydroxy-6-metoxy-1,4-benzoquinol methylase
MPLMRTLMNKLQPGNKGSELIDVKQLIKQLSDADLLEAADGYFAGLDVNSEQCHKPFSNVGDAIHITRNLSLLLQAADVFRGAEVLDFGCATGWLSLALANVGCSAVGVDISPSALRLAEAWCAQRGVRVGGAVRFLAYDGYRLPLNDSSVDRVVCFDAFHHVKDQAATLRELARVLRPGGRIAMLEPGPFHSKTVQSQAEMAQYKVIENDIVMADIAAAAERAGLAPPQMLVQLHEPLVLPFEQYQRWSGVSGLPKSDGDRLVSSLHRRLTDTQCFYLSKPGEGAGIDSRRPEGLAADLHLLSAQPVADNARLFDLRFRIRNTGEARWLSEAGALGVVNLGCQLLRPDNTVEDLNFMRFPLSASDTVPGAVVELTVRINLPPDTAQSFRFDLVAENTAWFEQRGRCHPIVWNIRG